jgi:maleate cis-trans isomerase
MTAASAVASTAVRSTRIGLLFPVGGPTTQEYRDFAAAVQTPIELLITRTGGLDRHDTAGILETGRLERLQVGIEALRPQGPDVIAFPCTCASFGYPDGARVQAAALASLAGVPATTASVALAVACQAMQVERLAIAAPYPPDVTTLLADFLTEEGLRVVGTRNMGVMSGAEVSELDAEDVYGFLASSDCADADALVVPDTALFTLRHVDRLERALGKAVITANQATMWHALQLAGVPRFPRQFGRLMNSVVRPAITAP